MKHKHAELMMLYAQDAMETDKPWERWEYRYSADGEWIPIIDHPQWGKCFYHPEWLEYYEYRRKPTTININGHEVPEPVRNPLENGTRYYIPHIYYSYSDMYNSYEWRGDLTDLSLLKKGVVHLTKEASIKHAEALLSFTSEDL